VSGEVVIGKIAAAIAKGGFEALKKMQPEYGRFWKHFQAELKPLSRDLPWDRLASLQVDPEFVGQATGLIRGDVKKRELMRGRIGELVRELPEGSRYDFNEAVGIVMAAADRAAVKAPHVDRDVTAAEGRRTRETFEKGNEKVLEALARLESKLAEQEKTAVRPEARPTPAVPAEQREARGPSGPTGGRQLSPESDAAETWLGRILEADPKVESVLNADLLATHRLPYRPDFVLRDDDGVNWMVEVKAPRSLNLPNVRTHVERFSELTDIAGQELDDEWRFALVTPESVAAGDSWSEVLGKSSKLKWD
jgi:hypothetical protein